MEGTIKVAGTVNQQQGLLHIMEVSWPGAAMASGLYRIESAIIADFKVATAARGKPSKKATQGAWFYATFGWFLRF
jgi:hypothetical protein